MYVVTDAPFILNKILVIETEHGSPQNWTVCKMQIHLISTNLVRILMIIAQRQIGLYAA